MSYFLGRLGRPANIQIVPIIILCLTFALQVGCSKRYKLKRENIMSESPWPFSRGKLSADGHFPNAGFNGKMNLLWERKERGKPIGPLTIYHEALIYPSTRKKIKFFDLNSGKKLGRIKSRGLAQSGVVVRDSMAFFAVGPRKNRLTGFNMVRNKRIWQLPVKDVSSGSILVNDRLIISSGDGFVTAIEQNSGEIAWKFSSSEKFLVSPSYHDGKLYQPGDRGTLFVLDADDGSVLYTIKADGPLVSQAAIAGKLFIGDLLGRVYAVDLQNGEIVWTTQVDGPLWASPAATDAQVIVGHSGGKVVAIDAASGDINWQFVTGEVVKAAPLIAGEFVIVGTAAGKVFCLRLADGIATAMYELSGSIAFPPVTDGSRIYVSTQSGRIACFGESNAKSSPTDNRSNTGQGSQ